MSKKIAVLTVLVIALPLAAFADGGIASRLVTHITALPEASTLGLLGSGLIGFGIVIRRKLKAL